MVAHERVPYARLTESLWNAARHPLRGRSSTEEFWALRDVSFDVQRGSVVGIIGRNGAGKSTLLKILSRITDPTQGEAILRGRVSSLLEVGTGFHPELTGRENIYLSGSILGMKRAEIERKFDEIVAFSEVERFLDTPIKKYSSGMQVRLGFAVAAHLEPEILIVDEVLAVGDAAFQRKSIGKMGMVAAEGRTVLLVSHNMGVIDSLCTRCILIERGHVAKDAAPGVVIRQYLEGAVELTGGDVKLSTHANRTPGRAPYLQTGRLLNSADQIVDSFAQGDRIVIELTYDALNCPTSLAGIGFNVVAANGVRVGGFNSYMARQPPHAIPQRGIARFVLRDPILTPGAYWITPSLGTDPLTVVDQVDYALRFTVLPKDIYGTGQLLTHEDGVVAFYCTVSIEGHGG
jgi:lipopolysaccharide transport system ATP-binding protein